MIVDWCRQCEKIYKTKKLSRDDPSDNKFAFRQEIVYLRYLKDRLGLSKSACFDEWKKIKNGVAAIFKDDEEQIAAEFEKSWEKIYKPRYADIKIDKELSPVLVLHSEVDYLNGLNVPVWVKQYWMCLLVFYKFEIQNRKRVYKTSTLSAWAIRSSNYKSKNYGGKCQDEIAEWQKRVGEIVIQDKCKLKNDTHPTYFPAFLGIGLDEKDVAMVVEDISDIKKVMHLLKETKLICAECGRAFVAGPKCKRKVCPRCWKRQEVLKSLARRAKRNG